MATLETPSGGPVVDLFLAINHYISTGDHAANDRAAKACWIIVDPAIANEKYLTLQGELV